MNPPGLQPSPRGVKSAQMCWRERCRWFLLPLKLETLLLLDTAVFCRLGMSGACPFPYGKREVTPGKIKAERGDLSCLLHFTALLYHFVKAQYC